MHRPPRLEGDGRRAGDSVLNAVFFTVVCLSGTRPIAAGAKPHHPAATLDPDRPGRRTVARAHLEDDGASCSTGTT